MNYGDCIGPNDRYRVDDFLGQGGMGYVVKAFDRRLERHVAVKLLPDALIGTRQGTSRLRREAEILCRLRHPHIVKVLDADLCCERPYIIQELLVGEDLGARLCDKRLLSPDEGRRIFIELAGALAYLHDQDVLHRDIKPGNVFIDADGSARLMDFGLARPLDRTRLTSEAEMVGTIAFLPPEVAAGADYVPQSDLFQLGLVMHLMITGRHLLGHDIAGLLARAEQGDYLAEAVSGDLPKDLRRWLEVCCLPRAEDRPADGAALVRLIQTTTPSHHRRAPSSSRPVAVTVIAAAVADSDVHVLRRRRVTMLSLVVVACLAVWVGFRRRTVVPFDSSLPRRPLVGGAVEWAVVPDGFVLAVANPTGSVPPQWRILAGEQTIEHGSFTRAGDWRVVRRGITWPPSATLEASVGAAVYTTSLSEPPTGVFAQGPYARFPPGRLEVSWRLHGHARLNVDVTMGDVVHRTIARAEEIVRVSLPEVPPRTEVVYRLSLESSELFVGRGLTGLSPRAHPAVDDYRPEDPPRLQDPLVMADDSVVAVFQPGPLVGLRPTPTSSGTVLVTAWMFHGATAVRPFGQWKSYLPLAVDGNGGVVCLSISPGEHPDLVRLVPAARRARWQAAGPTASWRTPSLDALAAEEGEWTMPLVRNTALPLAEPLADGRVLLGLRSDIDDDAAPPCWSLAVVGAAADSYRDVTDVASAKLLALSTWRQRWAVLVEGEGTLRMVGGTIVGNSATVEFQMPLADRPSERLGSVLAFDDTGTNLVGACGNGAWSVTLRSESGMPPVEPIDVGAGTTVYDGRTVDGSNVLLLALSKAGASSPFFGSPVSVTIFDVGLASSPPTITVRRLPQPFRRHRDVAPSRRALALADGHAIVGLGSDVLVLQRAKIGWEQVAHWYLPHNGRDVFIAGGTAFATRIDRSVEGIELTRFKPSAPR